MKKIISLFTLAIALDAYLQLAEVTRKRLQPTVQHQ